MISICIADNSPVVHQGIKSYFAPSTEISINAHVNTFGELKKSLTKGKIDLVLLDVELSELNSILALKSLVNENPTVKFVIFTHVAESLYAPPAIKFGVKGYVSKNIELSELEKVVLNVANGASVYSEEVKAAIAFIKKTKKEDRLFKKLSSREIEVLKHFNDGKKNKEVAKILNLDEKTISTYKLRLLQKLNVTNLVDLLKKAKDLHII